LVRFLLLKKDEMFLAGKLTQLLRVLQFDYHISTISFQ